MNIYVCMFVYSNLTTYINVYVNSLYLCVYRSEVKESIEILKNQLVVNVFHAWIKTIIFTS